MTREFLIELLAFGGAVAFILGGLALATAGLGTLACGI